MQNKRLFWTKKTGLTIKNRRAVENSRHPQWNTLLGQQRHASDKPFRCLQCPPDFQLVSKETCFVPESIHQIRPERKQCENPRLSIETCRQVITEKVSLALKHRGSSTQHPPCGAALPSLPHSLLLPALARIKEGKPTFWMYMQRVIECHLVHTVVIRKRHLETM